MKSKKINSADLKRELNAILAFNDEEEAIRHDALMLMAAYLSEIEAIQQIEGISRKDLALKINISSSYLTQVFRGDKPLNFYTLAKIKRELGLRFNVIVDKIGATYYQKIPNGNYLKLEEIKPKNNEHEGYKLQALSGGLYFSNVKDKIA